MSGLHAAAATVSLTDTPFPDGPPVFARGYEGDFQAIAIVVEAEMRVAFAACDALIIPTATIKKAVQRVAERTGLAPEQLLLCATHTHSGPPTLDFFGCTPDPEYLRRMEEGIVQAVAQACAQLDDPTRGPNDKEAELLFGLAVETTLGGNSRLLLRDGQIGWYGYTQEEALRPTGPHDPEGPVLAWRRPDGRYAAILFSHNVHNIGALQPGLYSPAFSGLARQAIAQKYDTTALFLPGAFGSSHNVTYEGSGLPPAELVLRLTAAVEEALEEAQPALFGPVRLLQRPFTYRLREFDEAEAAAAVRRYTERYLPQEAESLQRVFAQMRAELAPRQGESCTTSLTVIRLGEIALVGVPGELFGKLGLMIRRRSPFRHTFVIGLANEEIGYLPDVQAYAEGGYQTWPGWHCRVAPGTGEALVAQAVEMLEELRAEDATAGSEAVAQIRPLRPDDAPALQRFYNRLSAQSRRLFRPAGWNMSLAQCRAIAAAMAAGERFDLVLEERGKIVGWTFLQGLRQETTTFGIGLAETHQGRRYGRALMERLLAHARAAGVREIELTVVQSNERARRLYERFGFRKTGEWIGADGLPYDEMRLRLVRADNSTPYLGSL